jgi:xanthine dehydrogenase accessory factor
VTGAGALLRQARTWLEAGRGVALATVVRTWGSAPCPAGSLLVVNDGMEFVGSVSGGCVEGDVIRESLAAIEDGRPRLLSYGVPSDRAWAAGLACGGTIEVFVEDLAPGRDLLGSLLAAIEAKETVVRATDLPGGESRLLRPPAAASTSDPALEAAREAALAGESRAVEIGGARVFLGVFLPPVRLVIVGAVHVAQALAPMARIVGHDVVIVDPRPAFATEQRFPGAALVPEWPEQALARLAIDRGTAVVTLTHDPKIDDPALVAALRSDAFYVGALGSRRTQAARRERLRGMGFSEADLARVHGPVGLAIGAISPSEIAVSILAEVVSCLRRARLGRDQDSDSSTIAIP